MCINHLTKRGFFRFGVVGSALAISVLLLSGCTAAHPPEEGQNQSQIQTTLGNQQSYPLSQSELEAQPQLLPNPESKPKENPRSAISQSQKQLLKEIPILYYHSITEEAGNELRIPPKEFESHLKFLRQAGYESITLYELYQYFYKERELPAKPFVLTFDDGYTDNYTNAFPIAKKYGFSGTIFMVTGWIDGEGYLTKKQLREMSQAGWQIEAHTETHPKLNELTLTQLERELQDSKRKLEEILNRPSEYLAYPYGSYTEQVIRESKVAGYLMGFTTERGWANEKEPYQVHRVYCYANMGVEELERRMETPNY